MKEVKPLKSFLDGVKIHPDVMRDIMRRNVSIALFDVTIRLCDGQWSEGKARLAAALLDLLRHVYVEA